MGKSIKQKNLTRWLAFVVLLLQAFTMNLMAVDPFEIAVIGDTQNYYRVIAEGGPDIFTQKIKWIADNVENNNTVFLTHLGDITLDYASLGELQTDWDHASAAMSPLDGKIPYSMTFGNHDAARPGAFAASRYQGYSWYLGSPDDVTHAQIFSGGGINFLHINLPHNCTETQRNWAQGIITANAGKPTIISTHGYMADNTWGRATSGNNIWNDLIEPNEQVIMTFNGHDWLTRHEIHETTSGRKVLSMQVNWQ